MLPRVLYKTSFFSNYKKPPNSFKKPATKMASKNLYPQIDQSNPDSNPSFSSNSNHQSMYPSLQTKDLAENLFPDSGEQHPPAVPFESSEEVIVKIPSAIVHLIDKQQSIELASGELEIIRLRQSGNVVAVLARIGTLIQWPLAKDEAAVKLDGTHYFFTLRVPSNSGAGEDSGEYSGKDSGEELINYGLTISGSGSEELDRVLEEYSAFTVEEVGREVAVAAAVDGGGSAEAKAAAFWTTLAPNVEDYSGSVARLIASGSGQLIKGILWCGDVTVDRLKWGNEFLKIRMKSGGKMEVSPETLKRMKRLEENEKVFTLTSRVEYKIFKLHNFNEFGHHFRSFLCSYTCNELEGEEIDQNVRERSNRAPLWSGEGIGFFTGSIVNSKPGKKFFKLLPGEIVLASLDGFNKVCDAVEVAGRNVMSTTSTVTTDLVSHKHGEDAAKVTTEGMHAAGHAIGTAWAVFKIRKALNPKSVVKTHDSRESRGFSLGVVKVEIEIAVD
ncbi:hypothetical protein OSB04_014475 [Centaurea solstitialis]|uniref:Senescence domain-containing protein n=1 Tax=Centaurea solstitialis TaxID=347529 RepID=A0AA38WFL7_9ASTR|nr:hypothetical protein OSB04_014475 [Centaurea solstitialis]